MNTGADISKIVEIDDDHRVAQDFPCSRCGYNLRGQRIKGRCSECGASIPVSVWERLVPIFLADPSWRIRLARGAALYLVGLAIYCAPVMRLFTAGWLRLPGWIGSDWAKLIAVAIIGGGVWLFTSPNPQTPRYRLSVRGFVRWTATPMFVLIIGALLVRALRADSVLILPLRPVSDATLWALMLMTLAWVLIYFAVLARQLRWALLKRWTIPATFLGVIVFGGMAFVGGLSLFSSGFGGWGPTPRRGIDLTAAIVMSAVGVMGFIGSLVCHASLLVRLTTELIRAAYASDT